MVRHAEIEHSIVLEDSRIEDLDARVESSLIGRDVVIARSDDEAARLPVHGRRLLADRARLSDRGVGVRSW